LENFYNDIDSEIQEYIIFLNLVNLVRGPLYLFIGPPPHYNRVQTPFKYFILIYLLFVIKNKKTE